MSKWILILALNFSDGGTILNHQMFETKDACEAAKAISIHAVHQIAANPFLWAGTCMDTVNPPKGVKPPESVKPAPTPQKKQSYRDAIY